MSFILFYFRFFETESVAAITMMILKYGIEVKEEPEFIGETFEQRFARITSSEQYLSNTYAMPSLSCLPRPEFLSAPIACRWYSRGDNYLPESSPWVFVHSDRNSGTHKREEQDTHYEPRPPHAMVRKGASAASTLDVTRSLYQKGARRF